MLKTFVEEAAALASIVLFVGMIAVWAQLIPSSEPGPFGRRKPATGKRGCFGWRVRFAWTAPGPAITMDWRVDLSRSPRFLQSMIA